MLEQGTSWGCEALGIYMCMGEEYRSAPLEKWTFPVDGAEGIMNPLRSVEPSITGVALVCDGTDGVNEASAPSMGFPVSGSSAMKSVSSCPDK